VGSEDTLENRRREINIVATDIVKEVLEGGVVLKQKYMMNTNEEIELKHSYSRRSNSYHIWRYFMFILVVCT
jgi:hypothetical protein